MGVGQPARYGESCKLSHCQLCEYIHPYPSMKVPLHLCGWPHPSQVLLVHPKSFRWRLFYGNRLA